MPRRQVSQGKPGSQGRQIVLVTGCSTGIGRATAVDAEARGHRVFATARDVSSIADLASPARVSILPLDVTDLASIAAAVAAVRREAGAIDALVNNAGYGQYGAVEEVTPEEWRAQFDVNVFGSIEMIRAVMPAMREAKSGTIVNVSSVAGKISIPFAGPYCASKHALESLSDCLRVEVAPFGVRVVVVEPGPIDTRFSGRARDSVTALLKKPGPYAEIYKNAERAMDVDFQAGSLPPEAVARVILDAIESPNPKTRYRITRMAKTLIPLRRVLSDRAMDRQFRKTLKMPRGPKQG